MQKGNLKKHRETYLKLFVNLANFLFGELDRSSPEWDGRLREDGSGEESNGAKLFWWVVLGWWTGFRDICGSSKIRQQLPKLHSSSTIAVLVPHKTRAYASRFQPDSHMLSCVRRSLRLSALFVLVITCSSSTGRVTSLFSYVPIHAWGLERHCPMSALCTHLIEVLCGFCTRITNVFCLEDIGGDEVYFSGCLPAMLRRRYIYRRLLM